jgi:hypothetical protein
MIDAYRYDPAKDEYILRAKARRTSLTIMFNIGKPNPNSPTGGNYTTVFNDNGHSAGGVVEWIVDFYDPADVKDYLFLYNNRNAPEPD